MYKKLNLSTKEKMPSSNDQPNDYHPYFTGKLLLSLFFSLYLIFDFYFTANSHKLVSKNIDNLNLRLNQSINNDDKAFIKYFLNNPLLKSLIDVSSLIYFYRRIPTHPIHLLSIFSVMIQSKIRMI